MNPSHTPLPASGSVADHLDFATRLLDLFEPTDPRRAVWTKDIDRAHARLEDPNYYLAVVGEFSSGKSTFINALLGAELFASSMLRTTGAAVRVHYAEYFTVRVLFRDGQEWSAVSPVPEVAPTGKPLRPLRQSPGSAPQAPAASAETRARLDRLDLQQALLVVTTDPSVAASVRRVEVGYPSPLLASGLVVIDTPGSNSVDEGPGAGHDEIARDAVVDADAAVAVMPQDQVQALSLKEFLGEALNEGLLARCAFVVTRADHLDSPDYEGFRAEAARRISEHLDIIDPPVVLAAPTYVLRSLGGGAPGTEADLWVARFAHTRQWLRRLVEIRRVGAVTDTSLRLAQEVLEQLDLGLADDLGNLRQRQDSLDDVAPSDMNAFLTKHVKQARSDLDRAESDLRTEVRNLNWNASYDANRAVARAIEGCVNGKAIERVLDDTVPGLVQDRLADLADELRRVLQRWLKDQLAELGGRLQAAFAAEYARLEQIEAAPSGDHSGPAGRGSSAFVGADTFSAASALAADENREQRLASRLGAGAGAAIGTIIVPGLGTLIGAALGFLLSIALAKPIKVQQAEATERATESVDEVFATALREMEAAVREAAGICRDELEQQAAWYRQAYRQTVDAMHSAHRAEQQSIALRLTRLEAAHAESAVRGVAVATERARLRVADRIETADPFGGWDD